MILFHKQKRYHPFVFSFHSKCHWPDALQTKYSIQYRRSKLIHNVTTERNLRTIRFNSVLLCPKFPKSSIWLKWLQSSISKAPYHTVVVKTLCITMHVRIIRIEPRHLLFVFFFFLLFCFSPFSAFCVSRLSFRSWPFGLRAIWDLPLDSSK